MNFLDFCFNCEDINTVTSNEQCECENNCLQYLKSFSYYNNDVINKLQDNKLINDKKEIKLLRDAHINYLLKGLQNLSYGYVSLDASRPWIIYWVLHALYLLNNEPIYLHSNIISTLKYIQNSTGGFGGGPQQISQGAPNYAAVLALCIIGTEEALSVINRKTMYQYFLSMKTTCGGLSIHKDGEVDTRGTYTIIAIARILNILTDELKEGVADYVLSCQTYEGGFGGEPYNEAHGGYNFCAVATLLILNEYHRCNLQTLEHWLLQRQMKLEGGFQGRTNKLVDSCYSFWQGSAIAIVEIMKNNGNDIYDMTQYFNNNDININNLPENINNNGEINDTNIITCNENNRINTVTDISGCIGCNQLALQRYILHCCQNLDTGGLKDKPTKRPDYYHTCYSLSGLAISQSAIVTPLLSQITTISTNSYTDLPNINNYWCGTQVYGDYDNLLEPTSVVFNIGYKKLQNALQYYYNSNQISTHQELIEKD